MGATRAPALSPQEKKAERIFLLAQQGRLGREQFLRAMSQLEETHEGRVAVCSCTWLTLRNIPVCPESWTHWQTMRARLTLLVNEK